MRHAGCSPALPGAPALWAACRQASRSARIARAAVAPRGAVAQLGGVRRFRARSRMKKIIIAALVLVLLLAGGFLYVRNKQYNVIITQQQIDDALHKKFPVTKTHLLIFRLTYSNPHLTLLPESNRIEVGLDAEVNIKILNESKKLGGTVFVTSALAYRNETKQFFLSSPQINKLKIQGIPQQYLDKVTDFASNAAREYLQEFPVYTLTAKDTKTAAAKLLLKDVQVKSSEIHVTLGL